MKYPIMNAAHTYRKSVSGMNGGLNVKEPAPFINERQLADADNVYWDSGAIRTRPGLYTDATRSVHSTQVADMILATFTTGDGEYSLVKTVNDLLVFDKNGNKIFGGNPAFNTRYKQAFFAEGKKNDVYLFGVETDGTKRIRRITLSPTPSTRIVSGHVPTVFINGRGLTGYTENITLTKNFSEGFNVLTNRFKSNWTTDGEGIYFKFPFAIGAGQMVATFTNFGGDVSFEVTANPDVLVPVASNAFTVDIDGTATKVIFVWYGRFNCFYFADEDGNAIALPDVGFSGNVTVTANRDGEDISSAVFDMAFAEWFGGDRSGAAGGTRLFLGGHNTEENIVRYSDVDNPLYFPENSFLHVGDQSQKVTAFGKQNGVLVIFKEREMYFTEYAQRTVNGEALAEGLTGDITQNAFFPLTQLHPAIGCDLPRTVKCCGNRLVWACKAGEVYTLTSLSNWSEKAIKRISYAVEPLLFSTFNEDTCAGIWNGNYLLCGGGVVWLFSYMSEGFTYFNSYADEKRAGTQIPWYKWTFDTTFLHYDNKNVEFTLSHILGKDEGLLLIGETFIAGGDWFQLYSLSGETDKVFYYNFGGSGTEDRVITSRLRTKQFTLNDHNRLKMVSNLFLELGETGGMVKVSYVTNGKRQEKGSYKIRCRKAEGDVFTPVRFSARISRVRDIGVCLESTDTLAFAGLTWEYREMGDVK